MNEEITARQVRVIGPDGTQAGVLNTDKALRMAAERELDLVEIAPQATPPVCKIMDYGKFRYEQQKKDKLIRKKQQVVLIKEVRFHPNIDTHDFEFKVRHARQFLLDGNKVKASVVFRGRQLAHQEFGLAVLQKMKEMLNDLAVVEKEPNLEGRALIAIFAPDRRKISSLSKLYTEDQTDTPQ